MTTSIGARLCAGLLVMVWLALSSGCDSGPQRATVKGKVTIDGKPLTVGNVLFIGKDNFSGSATIDNDGNYVLNDAPVGEMQVAVTVPKLPPGGLDYMRRMKNNPGAKESESVDPNDPSKRIGIMGNIPENLVPIPDKYGIAETSGLKYTVKSGEQTYDIPLTN